MTIRYKELDTAKKDVFRKNKEKEEGVNYDNFINSLKTLNVQQVNIASELKKMLDTLTVSEDVKQEIMTRLEERHGIRR